MNGELVMDQAAAGTASDARLLVAESGTGGQPLSVDSDAAGFAELVRQVSGTDVCVCFQCGTCASGCPVAYAGDYTPTQVIHAVQLGLHDEVLRSRMIWLCTSCQICTTRCPQDVDVASVMEGLRIIARRQHVPPGEPSVLTFHGKSLANIRLFGRIYELGLVASLKMSTHHLTEDLGLGVTMLTKGKIGILPGFRGARAARRVIRRTHAIEGRR